MPLPRSEGRGPAEAVALKFSAERFGGDLREKDLKPIVLDVIDQADSARKLLFRGLVALGLLENRQAFLKASNVSRIVGEDVIRETNPAGKIRFEEVCNRLVGKAEVGEAVAIGLADEQICPLHYALPVLKALDFIDELFSCVRIIRKDRPIGF